MPPLRSAQGRAASKGKAATRPRQHLKDNVDPCEICGIVVSRKSDVPRHAKTHASDAEKLPCPWEGCSFRTLQKSNLDTHYRRHTQDRSYNCTDDPECDFQTCDPASLLRHRKRLHGYTPRASVGYKEEKPYKHVHVRVIRGTGANSGSVASQFSTFSSSGAASTSGSTFSTPAPRYLRSSPSPPPSPSPSPSPSCSPTPAPSPPPSYYRSRSIRLPPRPRLYSPPNSSGESEVMTTSSTPVVVGSHQVTPERSSPIATTVLAMTSPPVYYRTGQKKHLFSDSLLFQQSESYFWGLNPDHQNTFVDSTTSLDSIGDQPHHVNTIDPNLLNVNINNDNLNHYGLNSHSTPNHLNLFTISASGTNEMLPMAHYKYSIPGGH